MTILVIAEHDNNKLAPASFAALDAAQQCSKDLIVLVAGENCTALAEQVSSFTEVRQVILADNKCYKDQLAENMSALIKQITIELNLKLTHMLAPATTCGKNLLPRVAGLLDVNMISDIIEVCGPVTFKRPIYAGKAQEIIESLEDLTLVTVRPTCFRQNNWLTVGEMDSDKLIKLDWEHDLGLSKWVELQSGAQDQTRPELTQARVVISGGRGLQSKENFKLLEDLADKIKNSAIGASRAAVDAGFIANEYQVGQTGKVVAPELYIAVGISGAIQHIAGMVDSKVIVAINRDPDAPIFEIADYGLIGDLFEILPELTKKI